MDYRPNILLIGSTCSNKGKTGLTCRLVRTFAKQHRVICAKITVIRETNGRCPRGCEGCGVCTSLKAPFEITVETNTTGKKDTSRMLRSGAGKVLWLRVMKHSLAKGMHKLLSNIPDNACVIFESNSARLAFEPGMFLIVRGASCDNIKDSCIDVIPYADKVIDLDSHDPEDATDIFFENGAWRPRKKFEATAIILAGGKGNRMGSEKATLPFNGRTLIEHQVAKLQNAFEEVIVSGDRKTLSFPGLPVYPDESDGDGPLAGIFACLKTSTYASSFVIACDIPVIRLDLIGEMLDATNTGVDAVVPLTADGFHEPLYAVYNKTALSSIEQMMETSTQRRVSDLFDILRVVHMPLPPYTRLLNLNTPAEYNAFIDPLADATEKNS